MPFKSLMLAAVAATALAACGGSDNDFVAPPVAVIPPQPPAPTPPPPPPPPPMGNLEDGFGAGFAAAFQQDAFAEPIDPVTGDIIPLDVTADPVPVPDPQ